VTATWSRCIARPVRSYGPNNTPTRRRGYYASLAPLAVKDRVVVGVSGGDSGMRGFIASYSAATGEQLWRFYTILAKGEPGSETWGDFAVEWGWRRHLAQRNFRS